MQPMADSRTDIHNLGEHSRGGAGVSRRTFLHVASAGAIGLPLLLEACGNEASGSNSAAPVSAPASGAVAKSSGTSAGGLKLPTYVPFQGPKPDLPATPAGVPAAYSAYPKQLVKTVQAAPGKGSDVTATTFFLGAPPTALDQNPTWQEVNKELNVNLKMTPVSVADYFPTRLPTLIAGGNLPDIFLESSQGSSVQGEPEFLASQCSDLTPFLSGDNIKDYPNLANIPTFAWQSMVFDGKIFGVPLAKGGLAGLNGTSLNVKQKVLDDAGITGTFKNTDDFTKALKALTIPGKQWALGGTGTAPADPTKWFQQIFGVPNQWRNDGGKLTKEWETEEYKAALAYMRSLWDAGVFFPDTPALSGAQVGANWYQGKYVMWPNSFIAWSLAWNSAVAADPAFKPRVITPFSADGKVKPVYHSGVGNAGRTVLKKSSPDRIKELLGVLNFFAAPFGTQEQLLLTYGVKDVDFSFDPQGNPKQTQKGAADTNVPWAQLVTMPDVLYNANSAEFAAIAYQEETDHYALALANPVVGLYSKTNSEKSQGLNQKMADGIAQIVYGRSPVSSFDQLVKDWRSGGGDQIRTEFEQALQAAAK